MEKIELEILTFGVEDVIATSAAPQQDQFLPVDNSTSADEKL